MGIETRFHSPGHAIRMRRIINPGTGKTLVIPLDHTITTGPVPGLLDPVKTINDAAAAGADAIMIRPGMMGAVAATNSKSLGIILCLTGRFDRGVDHVQLNTVEYAAQCGADAVCAEFKFGSDGDLENGRMASRIAEEAHRFGLPVLMTIYALSKQVERLGTAAYSHACRLGEELGADMVKTSLPDDPGLIRECVSAVGIPVILAGGGEVPFERLRAKIKEAVQAGAAGAAVGRNVWSSPDPVSAAVQLGNIIHGGAGAGRAQEKRG